MKKKLITGVTLATLAVGGLMTARKAPQSALSDLQMENLEVLTSQETTLPQDCPAAYEEECHRILAGNTVHIYFWKRKKTI